jgi:hypothetical protein
MALAGFVHDELLDTNGKALKLATVEVRNTNGTLATLYSAATMGSTVANPTQADSRGNVSFWAANGEYDLIVTPQGGTAQPAYRVRTSLAPGLADEVVQKTGDQTITGTKSFAKVRIKSEVINPTHPDFGAKCDGVTDDSAAWDAVNAYIGSTNNWRAAEIYLPGPSALSRVLRFERKAIKMWGRGFASPSAGGDGRGSGFLPAAGWTSTTDALVEFRQSIGSSISHLHFAGNTDATKRPLAALRFFRAATGEAQPNTRNHLAHLWMGQRLGYEAAGTQFGNGVLIDGADANGDQIYAEDLSIRSCTTGWNQAGLLQAVAHDLMHCQFFECGTGIVTSCHMNLVGPMFLKNTVRDLDLSRGRVLASSISSEFSPQLARVRGAGKLVLDGEYFQISNSLSADGRIIDAIEDARNVVSLSNFDLRSRGDYTGPQPVIAVRRAGAGVVIPILNLDEVRYQSPAGVVSRIPSVMVDAPTPTRVTVG